jgi:hypothetical protein
MYIFHVTRACKQRNCRDMIQMFAEGTALEMYVTIMQADHTQNCAGALCMLRCWRLSTLQQFLHGRLMFSGTRRHVVLPSAPPPLGAGWSGTEYTVTNATYSHIVPALDDDECGTIGVMLDRVNRTRRKPAPVSLWPLKIPHDLTRARSRDAVAESQRLSTWAMARP